jgi:TolA-binding protein
MVPAEDWEIIPHKILADLRDEVEALKQKLSKPQEEELMGSISDLKKSISELHSLFSTALQQMSHESESEHESKAVQDIIKQLSEVKQENQQIAKAMVAIADMVEELPRKIDVARSRNIAPKPTMRPLAMPPINREPKMSKAPPMTPSPPPPFPSGPDMPPPPHSKGLFGKLFKK